MTNETRPPTNVGSTAGLGVTVGDAVMLRANLYEPDDCHPGRYLARKGEKLIVRKVKTDYVLPWSDPLCINVSHEDRTDGLTFVVRQSEIEPWHVTPNVGVQRPYSVRWNAGLGSTRRLFANDERNDDGLERRGRGRHRLGWSSCQQERTARRSATGRTGEGCAALPQAAQRQHGRAQPLGALRRPGAGQDARRATGCSCCLTLRLNRLPKASRIEPLVRLVKKQENMMIELIEETANMLRGMCMDPRIPQDTKEALWSRVHKLDAAVESALKAGTDWVDDDVPARHPRA